MFVNIPLLIKGMFEAENHIADYKFKFPAISVGGVYGFVVTASFLIGLQIKILDNRNKVC